MHDHLDAAVARLAARQHGLITAADATKLGLTPKMVRHRLATGRWLLVDRGVYRIAGCPVTWESTVLAHVLAAGDGAVASHRTAAVLWGVDGFRPGRPELTVPRDRRYRRPGVRTHESTDLHLVAPVRRRGIPTTPVARTILDAAAGAPPGRVELAIDHARRHRLTDWDELLDTLVGHARRGRDGVGRLRAILNAHAHELAVTGSGFERLVISLLLANGLPAPQIQVEVLEDGNQYFIDLGYPEERVAIELDGGDHLRRDVWERDRPRQNDIVLAGWSVLRFTWRFYEQHPQRLVAQVRRALAAGAKLRQ